MNQTGRNGSTPPAQGDRDSAAIAHDEPPAGSPGQTGDPVFDLVFAGTCDLALWCKLLRDKGWSGPRIARALGRSEGYVNNLIRVVDRASPAVMLRWRQEQSGSLVPVCATDWLVQLCLLPHDQQNAELQRRLVAIAGVAPPASDC